MDNNKETLPEGVQQPAVATPPAAPAPDGGSKKMILMLIVGMVTVILIVGGLYMFLSKQQSAPVPQVQQTTNVSKPPSLAQVKDVLDQELDSINVSASEGDFKSVDQNLQSL